MIITLDEQDIVDACCVYNASDESYSPVNVDVELLWDERKGFAADIFSPQYGTHRVSDQWIVDAIRYWLTEYYGYNGELLDIQLTFRDEVGAEVYVGR